MSADFERHLENLENLQKHYNSGDLFKYRLTKKGLVIGGPLSKRSFTILPAAKAKANFDMFATSSLKELKNILKEIKPEDIKSASKLKKSIRTVFTQIGKAKLSPELESEKKEVEALAKQFEEQTAKDLLQEALSELQSEPVPAAAAAGLPLTFSTSSEPMDARLFFHIHGDALGGDTGLEGHQVTATIGFLKEFLEQNPQFDPGKIGTTLKNAQELYLKKNQLQIELTHAKTCDEQRLCIAKWAKEVGAYIDECLERGETVGFPSGWAGDPFGHAIFMEISKEGADNYTVRFYNTGAGLDNAEAVVVDYKKKHLCFEEYKGIKKENLLNETLLKALLETSCFVKDPTLDASGAQSNLPTRYGAQDIYDGIVRLLQGVKSHPHYVLEDLMSAQRAGTCTWKSLCAFMRRNLSRAEYKRFKFKTKLDSLQQFYDNLSKEVLIPKKEQTLFRCSLEKFAREVVKFRKENPPIISTEEFQFLRSWIGELAHEFNDKVGRQKGFAKRPSPVNKEPISVFTPIPASIPPTAHLDLQQTSFLPPRPSPVELFDINLWTFDEKRVVDDFKKFSKFLSEAYFTHGMYAHVVQSVNEIYRRLPTAQELQKRLSGLSREDQADIISRLRIFNSLLFKATFNTALSEDSIFSMLKGTILTLALLKTADPRLPPPLGGASQGFEGIINRELNFYYAPYRFHNRHFHFADLKKQTEFEELSWLHDQIGISRLMHYEAWRGKGWGVNYTIVEERVGITWEIDVIRRLLTNQDFMDETESKYPGFKQLEEAAQIRFMLSSESQLAPPVFLAIREQVCMLEYFLSEKIERPQSTSKVNDFSIVFGTESRWNTYPIFTITGVTKPEDINWTRSHKAPREALNRYEELHRPFSNQSFDRLLDLVQICSPPTTLENFLISVDFKSFDIDLPREECIALFSCLSEDKFQHLLTLGFFSKNLDKLSDPDYQTIFQIFMLENATYLDSEMANNRGFVKKMQGFVNSGFQRALETRNLQTALFFHRINDIFSTHPLYQNPLKIDTLLPLVKTDEDKSAFYLEKAASYRYKNYLTEEDVVALLTCKIYLNSHPFKKENIDPKIMADIEKAFFKWGKKIDESLKEKEGDKILSAVLHELGFEEEVSGWKEMQFPIWQSLDGKFSINIMSGTLKVAERERGIIPYEIRERELYKYFFDGQNFSCEFINSTTLAFQDSSGANFIIGEKGYEIVIQKKIDGRLFQFIPKKELQISSNTFPKALAENYDHWESVDPPKVLWCIDHKSNKVEYEISLIASLTPQTAGIIQQISPANEKKLILADVAKVSFFSAFEDLQFIHPWILHDSGKLVRVDLPRFNLHFDVEETSLKRKFLSHEFPGFHLAPDQNIPGFEDFTAYIVLVNDRGEKKVIIPKQELMESQEGSLFPTCPLERSISSETRRQSYSVYDLDERGIRLQTRRIDDSYHLALVHLALHHYKEAFEYLKEKGSLYTEEEIRLLDRIINSAKQTHNDFPDAIAIRLHAAYLKAHNETLFGQPSSVGYINDYRKYLNSLNNVSIGLQLPLKEELLLLNIVYASDPLFAERKNELDGSVVSADTSTLQPSNVAFWEKAKTMSYVLREAPPESSALVTRWGRELLTNFQKYYELALSPTDTPEKKELLERLIFAKHDPDDLVRIFAATLEIAAQNRDSFPPYRPDKEPFFKEIVAIAAEIDRRSPSAAAPEVPKLTPPRRSSPPKPTLGVIPKYEVTSPSLTYLEKLVDDFFVKRSKSDEDHRLALDELEEVLRERGCDVEDLAAYRGQRKEEAEYQLRDPEGLRIHLQQYSRHLDAQALKGQVSLISLANKKSALPEEVAESELKQLGKKAELITFDDIILCSIRDDFTLLKEKNPQLNEEDIAKIVLHLTEFLVLKTLSQQASRARSLSSAAEMAQSLLAKRQFEPSRNLKFMVFEYFSNILMREDQVKKLELLLSSQGDGIVAQMIMGSGKSKVLLPIIGLSRADGKNLSTVIVPEALYKQTVEEMSHNAFSQAVMTLEFGRTSQDTEAEFSRIFNILNETIDEKKVLITTSKSIQSIYLKALESFKVDPSSNKSMLLKKILWILKKNGHVIIDEADEALNCRRENNYSFGKSHPLEQGRLELSAFLYEAILEEEGNFEFPAITDEYYHTIIKPHLVKKLQERWKELDQKLLFEYLMGLPQNPPFVDSIKDQKMKDLLALAKEQLNLFLPLTLKKNCDENYGLAGNMVFAIPFAASNTPLWGTQFGVPYESVNYTIQAYLKKGISKGLVKEAIHRLQDQAMNELRSNDLTLEQSESYKKFLQMSQGKAKLSLFQVTDEQVDKLAATINETPQAKLRFISDFILGKIEIHDQKLSSNPQDLVDLFAVVQGFTGTLWNEKSFPTRMRPMKEAGTDARTLVTLWQKSRGAVHVTTKHDPKEIVRGLRNISAFIDTGGVLRGYDNQTIAIEMLGAAPESIRGVVFFDTNNRIVILERGKESPIPLEESSVPVNARMTLYDQKHTTGADITQKADAVGLVTIGPHTFLRDVLQSVWRLRKLELGQRVEFLIPSDVKALILKANSKGEDDSIELEDIIIFCMKNQSKRQSEDNYIAMRQKMHHLVAKKALEDLMSGRVEFKDVETLFFHSTEDRPYETYGTQQKEVPIESAITREIARLEKLSYRADFESVVDRESLPDMVVAREGLETSVEVETEKEREIEQVKPREVVPYNSPWPGSVLSDEWFTQQESVNEILSGSKFHNVFSPYLRTTKNFHTLEASDKTMNLYGLLYHKDKGEYEVVLMDVKDADLLQSGLKAFDTLHAYKVALVQPQLGVVSTSQRKKTESKELDDPKVKMLLVQAKFLNGEVNYSKEELLLLKRWISEKGPQLLKELFVDNIIKPRLAMQREFPTSTLAKLFAELGAL